MRCGKWISVNKRFFISLIICAVSVGILICLDREINTEYIVRQILVLSLISMGAVFVFTVGSFGISLGVSTLLSVVTGGVAFMHTQSYILSALTCIFVPLLVCVAGNFLIRLFRLPPYASAVIILTFCISVSWLILGALGGAVNTNMPKDNVFNTLTAALLCFALFAALCVTVEYVLPLGKRQKELGHNQNTARLYGISPLLYSTLAFAVAGLAVGIGGFLILCADDSIGKTQVSDLGFNIIFALFLGGMPVAGGKKSNFLCGLLGSIAAVFIREIFVFLSLPDGISQSIRALILIVVLIGFEKINGEFNA